MRKILIFITGAYAGVGIATYFYNKVLQAYQDPKPDTSAGHAVRATLGLGPNNAELDVMAQVIAAYVSGVELAQPEQDDYHMANKIYRFIESEINDNVERM